MLMLILEAALRSILMAVAVWAVIRVLRVQAVFAQKTAWVLVLAAAAVMPLVMHLPWLATRSAVRVPLEGITARQLLNRMQSAIAQRLPAKTIAHKQEQASAPTAESDTSLVLVNAGDAHITAETAAPRKSVVIAHRSQQPAGVERKTGETGSIVNLPLTPIEISLKLPVALPARVGFWTARRIRLAVILLYAAVVGALLLRTFVGLAAALHLLRRSRKVQFLSGAGSAMRVRSSADLATPVTIGSTILLPAGYDQWDEEKLRVVLAHEYSHVCQRDFYLQLAATIHAAIFWFSPLGWWLKRKLSDLGEALSDRAALAQADDAASYAQVLLEFAAAPRRAPLAGVAMARRSNLSSRIERILNDRRFQLAFLGGRRHAILSAVLVPVALLAAVAGFRIVPAVHAASAGASTTIFAKAAARGVNCDEGGSLAMGQTLSSEKLESSDAVATTLTGSEQDQVSAQAPVAPLPPTAPAPDVAPAPPAPPVSVEDDDSDDDNQSRRNHNHSHTIVHSGDEDDSFSIVHENGDGSVHWNGEYNDRLAEVRKKMGLKGNYIWFEREGKSYVITDPAVIAQADAMFKEDPALERQQKALEEKQKVLEKQMNDLEPEKAKINVDSPQFKKQMADLNAQLAKIQSVEFKQHMADLNKQVDQEALSHLQEQMGAIQEQIGEIQGQIGEEMGKLGEQQGQIGEQMGRLGEEMGRIGEEQGRHAEEASRKMQSVLDQALRNGKAKPVD